MYEANGKLSLLTRAAMDSGSDASTEQSQPKAKNKPASAKLRSQNQKRKTAAGSQAAPVRQARRRARSASSSAETSLSPESKRVASAASAWTGKSQKQEARDVEADSDSEAELPQSQGSAAPATGSGLCDYADYLFSRVLTAAERNLLQRKHAAKIRRIGEFCAGMGSATMASCILQDAMLQSFGQAVAQFQTAFITECVTWKRQLCESVVMAAHGTSEFSNSWVFTGDLAKAPQPEVCDIGVMGIECDDISQCSSTPKSVVDGSGRSGRSFLQFLQYLEGLRFSSRPRYLLMECVSNLHHKRSAVNELKRD